MRKRHLYLIIVLHLFLFHPIFTAAQEITAENFLNEKERAEVSDDTKAESDKESTIRKRIIDARTIKERRSLPGSILLKPFRAVAPAVTNRLTRFEENREYELLFGLEGDFPVNPQFGSTVPGSGFGVGFTVSTRDHLSKDLRLAGSSLVTFAGYVENTAGIEITPQKFEKNKLKIKLNGRQSIRPKEDFFGSGAGSFRSERTTFFRRQLGARLEAEWQFNAHIKAGAFTEFSRNDITDGKDARGVPISRKFDSNTLAGLGRNIRLLDSGVFVEIEKRDRPDNPHAGWFARFSFSNTDGLGRSGDFGWFNYAFDTRAYIPLGTKDRVLALRLIGDFRDKKGNSAIPFFRLAKLGDSETLRGYEIYRFQGVNALHLNVEYRFKLMQGIETGAFRGVEAVFFGDFGQVFDNRRELNWKNLHGTWGGGIQFTSRQSVAFAVLYAVSPETGRLIMRFGKTF